MAFNFFIPSMKMEGEGKTNAHFILQFHICDMDVGRIDRHSFFLSLLT